MIKIQALADTDLAPLLQRMQGVDRDVDMAVQGIAQLMERGRDTALLELTRRLDGVSIKQPFLDQDVWDELAASCPVPVRQAIDGNLARIEAFHALQVGAEQTLETPGLKLGRRPVPFARVACYVPGGRAIYPSSVLMTVVPAKLAGVSQIVVVTPPTKDGKVSPEVAYAAQQAGATKVLLAGGAQGIFAVAWGTQAIEPVQAIVGPGNAYVTAAKQWVRDQVQIDGPAGPSELLVIADDSASGAMIAWDLIAQAEHDPDAQVVLATTSQRVADETLAELERLVPAAARTEIIQKSLQNAAILVATSGDELVTFANQYAPEHLEIIMQDPHGVLARIENAGSVFLGPQTPVSLGDYGSGTNHVLPTMGFASLRGGLSVDDFRKWITWQEATPEGLAEIASDVATLARAEGLIGHAEAVERRLP